MRSIVLIAAVIGVGGGLTAWKHHSLGDTEANAANEPEPVESISVAVAQEREYRPTMTSIGTVLALQSITLRNELPGTVSAVKLVPGQIVEAGESLVALDVSVEEAELKAQQAQAQLAETTLARTRRLAQSHAASQEEFDRALSVRDVAVAQIARIQAIIAKKTIRSPFRARVGLADVHPGQFLNEGTELTTLQGIADAAHVDFAVPQRVAEGLSAGDSVDVLATSGSTRVKAKVIATDARVDSSTRNRMVRARVQDAGGQFAPGASVRVHVASGKPSKAVSIPVSALRKGPEGDHVFVVEPDKDGNLRAYSRSARSGPMVGDEIMIYAGVAAGERIAASGSFKLRDAALVSVAGGTAAGSVVALHAGDKVRETR